MFCIQHQIIRIPHICQNFTGSKIKTTMLQTKFPLTHGMFQTCIKQQWANHITLFHTTLNGEGPGFMGSNCYGCRRVEFVTARISRIQFAQRYVMCIYGVRITFVLFAPVPETGCPMWHAGLTLTLTLLCLCIHVFHVSKFECCVFFFLLRFCQS